MDEADAPVKVLAPYQLNISWEAVIEQMKKDFATELAEVHSRLSMTKVSLDTALAELSQKQAQIDELAQLIPGGDDESKAGKGLPRTAPPTGAARNGGKSRKRQ